MKGERLCMIMMMVLVLTEEEETKFNISEVFSGSVICLIR